MTKATPVATTSARPQAAANDSSTKAISPRTPAAPNETPAVRALCTASLISTLASSTSSRMSFDRSAVSREKSSPRLSSSRAPPLRTSICRSIASLPSVFGKHVGPTRNAGPSRRRSELRQNLFGVETEEALLVGADLVDVDVVEAGVGVLPDLGPVPFGV